MNDYYASILETCHCKRCMKRRARRFGRTTLDWLLIAAGALVVPLALLAMAIVLVV